MTSLNQQGIIALNSKAVVKLTQGQYQDAAKLLGKAIRMVQQGMLDHDTKLDDESQEEKSEEYALESCPVDFDAGTDSSVFSLYNRALLLTGIDNKTIFSSRNEATVSGVLLFNVALCYHLLGLQQPSDQRKLEKALQFYKAAAAVIGLNYNLCGADHLIYLAVYNNKAHIFSILLCEEDAQRCLSWLKESLEVTEEDSDQLFSNELVDIHLNVALFHGSRRHAPAA
jgi:tetratricopeptide (TPR) repeat protein